MDLAECYGYVIKLLLPRLVSLPLAHLGLLLKGSHWNIRLEDDTDCFKIFTVLKGLKSFNIVKGAAHVSPTTQGEIEEKVRIMLIQDYIPKVMGANEQTASAAKNQGSDDETPPATRPSKQVKSNIQSVSLPIIEPHWKTQTVSSKDLALGPTTEADMQNSVFEDRCSRSRSLKVGRVC